MPTTWRIAFSVSALASFIGMPTPSCTELAMNSLAPASMPVIAL
jgi:hypothetical protein